MERKKGNAIASRMMLVPFLALFAGWGEAGHRIVGEIAWNELTEEAKREVERLLGTDSNDRYHTLAGATLWADDIKGKAGFPNYSHLHYVNIPKGADGLNMNRDCPSKGCVVSAIRDYSAVLADDDLSDAERLEALKFIAHFVGDVHQPLHAGYPEDKGGNTIKVRFFERKGVKLHAVWDTSMIAHTGKAWKAYADELRGAITDEDREEWKSLDPEEWTNESYRAAVQTAYRIPNNRRLAKTYHDRSLPVLEAQLKKGGYRLAALLNKLFSTEETDEPMTLSREHATSGAAGTSGDGTDCGVFSASRCAMEAGTAMAHARTQLSATISAERVEQVCAEVYLESFRACLRRGQR